MLTNLIGASVVLALSWAAVAADVARAAGFGAALSF
jgi:hypothetical protein